MAVTLPTPNVATVSLSIDGREVTVPKGTNLIEAARKLGIDVPYLCYHHQLTSFGGCRLCLVEVEKVPKLLAACNTIATDGMVVRTSNARIKSQREGTLEFILLNHPLDCPICDKGGECELQDRVFEHSNAASRMTEPKIHIEDYDLGPLIVRNQDRCIICKRCIKVMEEIAGEPVLEFGQRGVTTEVYTYEHEEFKPGFSGNTIRVCPVGALMSKPFRFKARPWELIKTPSVCGLCSVGCNVRLDVRENKLLRVVGLENPQVNDGWLCDRGQFGYDYVNSPERLQAPMIRRAGGHFEQTSWEEALGLIVTRLSAVRESGSGFAAIGSDRSTNEDAFALQQFTRGVMGSADIDHRMGVTRTDYRTLRPAVGSIQALPSADVVLTIGTDVTAEAPVLDLVLKRSLLTNASKLLIAHPRKAGLSKFASAWLQYRPGTEIALVEGLAAALGETGGRTVARAAEETGLTADQITSTAQALAGAKLGSVLFGQAVADAPGGEAFLAALQRLVARSGQAEKPGHVCLEVVAAANAHGARDMGLLPFAGPNGGPCPTGRDTTQILQAAVAGGIRALWISETNPMVEFPDQGLVESALEGLDLLVVQDLYLTETARRAHVVLPALSLAERAGTLTNVEGRVQRAVRALDPKGGSRAGWEVLQMIAEDMGSSLGYSTADSVTRAIRQAFEATAGPSPAVPATPPAPPVTSDEFPLRLFTGRLMFDRSTVQCRSTVLPGLAPDPFAEVHPDDAARHGIKDGGRVQVSTQDASLALDVRVTRDIPAGSVFVPSGYTAASAASLFGSAAAVVACAVAPLGSDD